MLVFEGEELEEGGGGDRSILMGPELVLITPSLLHFLLLKDVTSPGPFVCL